MTANVTGDVCDQVKNIMNYPVLPIPYSFRAANWAVIGVYFVLWCISLGIFLYYRDKYQRLRVRSRVMVIVQGIGCLIQPCTLPMVFAVGVSAYPCDLFFYICFWALPMMAQSQLQMVVLFRSRRKVAKEINNFEILANESSKLDASKADTDTIPSKHDDNESISTPKFQRFEFSWEKVLLSSKGFGCAHLAQQILFILIARILQEFQPYIGHGCYGCTSSLLELIAVAGSIMLVSTVCFIAAYYERDAPDPFGILREAWLQFIIPGTFATLGCLLIIFDPGHFYRDSIFNYAWVITLGPFSIHNISTTYQVYVAWKERKEQTADSIEHSRTSSFSGEEIVDRILKDETLAPLFEKHIESEFSSENIRCYVACKAWRNTFDSRGVPFREKWAREIYAAYIAPNATVMQVNISSALRDELIKELGEVKYVRKGVFDKLITELGNLMACDSVPRFYRSNPIKEAKGGSKVISMSALQIGVASS